MTSKSTSRAEILQFLDDLDNLPTSHAGSTASTSLTSEPPLSTESTHTGQPMDNNDTEAQDALNFLNQLTQRSSTPLQPAANPPRTSSDLKRTPSKSSVTSLRTATPKTAHDPASSPAQIQARSASPIVTTSDSPKDHTKQSASGSWGWSSMWNSASSVIQQAREATDHQISPHMPHMNLQTQQEQAKKWTGSVLGSIVSSVGQMDLEQVRKSGLKAMSDIINAVAPPIAEHEVIQVWLTHDMLGYEGVETLVYKALAKVMEQVEGGELHVNKGTSSLEEASTEINDDDRNLNAILGFKEAHQKATAELDALISKHPAQQAAQPKTPSSSELPITICPVYLRIQPLIAEAPWASSSSNSTEVNKPNQHLFFLFLFKDVLNKLEHSTLTQGMPASWLDIPFEENEWVENEMVDVIRKGVEIIGQDYIRTRQTGRDQAIKAAHEKHEQDMQQANQPSTPASSNLKPIPPPESSSQKPSTADNVLQI